MIRRKEMALLFGMMEKNLLESLKTVSNMELAL